MPFVPIEDALERIRSGEIVIVVDDEDRENEGDFTMAAERVSPEAINFMLRHGRGLVCMPCNGDRLDELRIPAMVSDNTSSHDTAFTVSIDHRSVTTGISAAERAVTIREVLNAQSGPADFIRPGHVFPLRAREGGVLTRAGHTEASVDLAQLAGLAPAAVICEVLNEDGTTARLMDLEKVAVEHNLALVTIADLIAYRRRTEKLVKRTAGALLPTEHGVFKAHVYESLADGREHVALVLGEPSGKQDVLVRVHSECLTGDVFGSLRCECGTQVRRALARIAQEGEGVFVYIRGHEGRGIGLRHKLQAYQLQESGRDTVEANEDLGLPADARDYGIGSQILADLGISTIRLLTNNPAKRSGIERYGLKVVERLGLQIEPTSHNLAYLRAKRDKLGHLLDLEPQGGVAE